MCRGTDEERCDGGKRQAWSSMVELPGHRALPSEPIPHPASPRSRRPAIDPPITEASPGRRTACICRSVCIDEQQMEWSRAEPSHYPIPSSFQGGPAKEYLYLGHRRSVLGKDVAAGKKKKSSQEREGMEHVMVICKLYSASSVIFNPAPSRCWHSMHADLD